MSKYLLHREINCKLLLLLYMSVPLLTCESGEPRPNDSINPWKQHGEWVGGLMTRMTPSSKGKFQIVNDFL